MKASTLALVLIVLIVACSYVSSDTANYYCGRRLSNVLASLCWNDQPPKRNAGWWPAPAVVTAPEGARSLSGTRGKRGPVDECCYKPCTVDELMTYC